VSPSAISFFPVFLPVASKQWTIQRKCGQNGMVSIQRHTLLRRCAADIGNSLCFATVPVLPLLSAKRIACISGRVVLYSAGTLHYLLFKPRVWTVNCWIWSLWAVQSHGHILRKYDETKQNVPVYTDLQVSALSLFLHRMTTLQHYLCESIQL
jgi:hypothetical protein